MNTGKAPPEPLLASGLTPAPVDWGVPACSGVPAAFGDTLCLSGSGTTLLDWTGATDATGYLTHRWENPDRSGEDHTHHQVATHLEDPEVPELDQVYYFEVNSTNACGEGG